MLILTFFFALGTEVRISQQKVDFNHNKKVSFSSRFAASLGWFGLFWFSFLLKLVRFVKSTGLHSLETGVFICCKGAVQSSTMFSSLTSADWHHLQSSHRTATTAFSRQKLILTDVVRRGADHSFVALLPLMANQWSHLCTQLHPGDSESHSSFQACSMPECQTLRKKQLILLS